jgi:hypothetical protein
MIESFGIKLDDIEFAALVIGVAGFAFGGGNARTFAMKTKLCRDVCSNFLVALQAKAALAFL